MRSLASREVTVIVVNHSSELLELDTDSVQLWRGKWEEEVAGRAPVAQAIRPGESVLWRCKSTGIAQGIVGSATFHITGHPPHDRVRFTWKNRFFGPNAYNAQCTREGFKIKVEGGEGASAVVVFILGQQQSSA
ncbi:hypothetical protein C8A03DRAFT_35835 [Achaetomium macrosporum]|uniref:Uncharacterized protein n=1 Tax=Achaetomium macrosporum TaxID=79813 RepID=A0AAN7HD03_9PEZI|nr:hypothetical protein C8A03DRAFT_35835 [Achaetomium macrosporum]